MKIVIVGTDSIGVEVLDRIPQNREIVIIDEMPEKLPSLVPNPTEWLIREEKPKPKQPFYSKFIKRK